MAQVNKWDGGLSSRVNPLLININEGITYTNIDNTRGTLKPLKADTTSVAITKPNIYNFNSVWIESTVKRSYVEFQEKLYYSDSTNIPQKTSDGTTWYNLGIKEPLVAPTAILTGAGPLTGTIQYCYTYYNSADGSESPPSPYSNELIAVSNQINIPLLASTDPQVTNIKLYRLGSTLTSMFLVVTLANTSVTYTDSIADIDIEGFPLDTANSGQAQAGLQYLTEANAMLFGAIGNKLWYSEIADSNSWGPFNFIDFDGPVTGIGSMQNGIAVFTYNKAYIITGNSPSTLSKYLVSGNQGCISHSSIRFVNNTLVWLSNDGICASNGGDIQILTKDKIGIKNLGTVKDAIVHNETYYLSLDTYTLIMDFRFGLSFRTINIAPTSFFASKTDILYYALGTNIFINEAEATYKTMTYRSGDIAEGAATNLKHYKVFYVNSIGNLTIKIYLDNVLVQTSIITSTGLTEIKIPQLKQAGYIMSYEVIGTGELLELEYKAEGRQNGR